MNTRKTATFAVNTIKTMQTLSKVLSSVREAEASANHVGAEFDMLEQLKWEVKLIERLG